LPATPPLSINDLVPRVRDLLGDAPYTVTSTTTGTGATVTVPDGTRWAEGDIGEWQTGVVGYEQFLVTADPAGNTLTTSRGYNGTTAETHDSGDRVAQGPTFTGRQIQQALLAAVRSLWPFVYRTEDVEVTPSTTEKWFDITAPDDDVLGIVSVSQRTGPTGSEDIMFYGTRKGIPIKFGPEVNDLVVPSGQGLYIPYFYDQTNPVVVKVMEAVTGDNDIEDNSLFPVADYLIYYAAGRLTGATEIPRVAQGADLEASGTVGAGARSETGRGLSYDAKKMLELLAIKYRLYYRPLRSS
jgi:hypothetical protein